MLQRSGFTKTKNRLDAGNFDNVTRLDLLFATLDRFTVDSDVYVVAGSRDVVSIVGSINRGGDVGSEPPLESNPGHFRFSNHGQSTGQNVTFLIGAAFHDGQCADGLMYDLRGRSGRRARRAAFGRDR